MNNIVWSCCVLHNLLLGVDGLDKLWTEEDYLSTWCVMTGPALVHCDDDDNARETYPLQVR